MSNQKKGIFWALISLLIMGSIFGFSSQTNQESSSLSLQFAKWLMPFIDLDVAHFLIRKLAHFSIYALLGFSIYRSLSFFFERKPSIFLICMMIVVLYASLDEFHQLFVVGRSGEFRDVCIDSCGGFLGSYFSFWLKKWI